MHQLANDIVTTVEAAADQLRGRSESVLAARPGPGKWSPKEVIGHLVDSAHNNIRRFVCGQYQSAPHIVYHQDEWVALQRYQDYDSADLLDLWVALNRHLAHVWQQVPESRYALVCDTGKEGSELHTLQWLAEDYLSHLRHHLVQAGV